VRFAKAVMLLIEANHAGWFVHVPRDIPNIEVLSSIHHEEFAKAVHETTLLLVLG
jgi:hypothetical protein